MMHSLYGGLCADPLSYVLMDPSLQQHQQQQHSTKDTTFTKIFVGGLPYHTTDKTLKEYFEQFGETDEAVVITDRQTGKSRGYGFVTMKDRAGAEHACRDPNPIIDGRKANVNLAYLGAKPRNNAQLGLPFPLQTATILQPTGRLGLPQLYYPASPLLAAASPATAGLVMQQSLTQLSPNSPASAAAAAAAGGHQYFDYASTANLAAAAGYDPLAAAYAAAALGVVPASVYHQRNAAAGHEKR